jgi:hypothetical protein
MKRQILFSCLTATLLLLPHAALGQAQPAPAKPAAQSKSDQKPVPAATAAAKRADGWIEIEAVKSAAFADYDNDGRRDIVLDLDLDNDLDNYPDVLVSGASDGLFEVVTVRDQSGIGASLAPAGDTLRAQLKLTKGQGLVVTKVTPESPAAKAGLQVDDILLSAGDRPLAKPSDVSDIVNSPVKRPFTVECAVLRAGERRKVSLTVTEDTAGHYLARLVEVAEPSYRIGVEVSDASSTLRAQLKLPKDQGIVIDRVLPDSPAQKVGFKEHDVLVYVRGTPLTKSEDLRAQQADVHAYLRLFWGTPLTKSEDLSAAVKASAGKTLKFSVLRGGQKMEIDVTPEKRDDGTYRVRTLTRAVTTRLVAQEDLKSVRLTVRPDHERAVLGDWVVRTRKPSGDTAAQIERMLKQIDDLRDSVKALQGTVAKQQAQPKPTPPKTDLPTKPEPPKK